MKHAQMENILNGGGGRGVSDKESKLTLPQFKYSPSTKKRGSANSWATRPSLTAEELTRPCKRVLSRGHSLPSGSLKNRTQSIQHSAQALRSIKLNDDQTSGRVMLSYPLGSNIRTELGDRTIANTKFWMESNTRVFILPNTLLHLCIPLNTTSTRLRRSPESLAALVGVPQITECGVPVDIHLLARRHHNTYARERITIHAILLIFFRAVLL